MTQDETERQLTRRDVRRQIRALLDVGEDSDEGFHGECQVVECSRDADWMTPAGPRCRRHKETAASGRSEDRSTAGGQEMSLLLNEQISLFYGKTGKEPGRVRMTVRAYARLLVELGAHRNYRIQGGTPADQYGQTPGGVLSPLVLVVWGMTDYVPVVPDRSLESGIAVEE